MKNILFIFFLLFLLSLSACKDDPVTPPLNSIPDSTSHNFIWEIDTIGYFQSFATSVWATDFNNIWLFGLFYSTPDFSQGSNIAHWDGHSWTFFESIWEYSLNDCVGFDSTDIWAVGGYAAGARICHWNGSTWTINKFPEYDYLYSIWGTNKNSLYAVGLNGLIIHYDGLEWEEMNSGTSANLVKIWGTSESDIYAVGGIESQGIGVLLHYDGNRWRKLYERTTQSGIPSGFTTAIWGPNDSDYYYLSCGSGSFRGKDTIWEVINPPTDNTYIYEIVGVSHMNIFMIGYFGLSIHWNGKSWYRFEEFYRKPNGDILQGAWVSQDKLIIVGSSEGNKAIIYKGKMIY
ncbi:MAG: hypothetical protein IPM56_01815 [Ignavibacteriales bacterium]|nr:MAG: hypothetical protein IPM56_01815 [Ignavibacteriales bacterium]